MEKAYAVEGGFSGPGELRELAVGCSNGDIALLAAGPGKRYRDRRILRLKGQVESPVGAVCWSKQDEMLVGGRQDGSLLVLDVAPKGRRRLRANVRLLGHRAGAVCLSSFVGDCCRSLL